MIRPEARAASVEQLIQKKRTKSKRILKDLVLEDKYTLKDIKAVLKEEIRNRDVEKVRYYIKGFLRQFTDDELHSMIDELGNELKASTTKKSKD